MIEIPLTINPEAPAALHRQVYDALRAAILSGRLRPGDRLPATRALAEQLSLSRTTVAEAYDQLRAEGYIEGRHGSGTFVAFGLPANPTVTSAASAQPARRPLRLSHWGQRIAAGGEVVPIQGVPR